jgi:hypothetical protein
LVRLGQLIDSEDEDHQVLNGLGRRIKLKPIFETQEDGKEVISGFEEEACWIAEGQFENDYLTGFGRMLIGKETKHDIGFYKDDLMHGYAQLHYKGKMKEGLFEKGHFRK